MVNRVVAHPSPRNHNRKTQFLLYQCDHEFNCPRTDKSSVEHPEKQYDQLKTKKNIQPTLLSPLSSKIPSSRLSPCLPRFAHEPQPQPSWLNATRRLSPIIFLSAKKKSLYHHEKSIYSTQQTKIQSIAIGMIGIAEGGARTHDLEVWNIRE